MVETLATSTPIEDLRSTLAAEKLPAVDGDLAEWNLLCAKGLPGSQSLEIGASLTRLDEIASRVYTEIRRNYHRFLNDQAQADHSQAKFCVLMMVTVLQQDFGVCYNPERIRNPDFRSAGDLFIHGMLDGEGGTCASMPVLYAAIGRRLGWPIKLACTRGHLFCRWDDPHGAHPFGCERFNLEGTGRGANLVSDDYYRQWPEPLSDEMIERGGYLKSLTREEELAAFLAMRGHCLEDNGWIGKALEVYRWSCRLAPRDPHFQAFYDHAILVHDRILEEGTLRDYFGPDTPLPFGYFQRHVLRQMASNMLLAQSEFWDRQNRAEKQRMEAKFRWQNRGANPHQFGHVYQSLAAPFNMAFPSSHNAMTTGVGQMSQAPPTPMSPFSIPHSPFDSVIGCDGVLMSLPARQLQTVDPDQLAIRRQEAVAICKALPPGIAIRPIRRQLLVPPETGNSIPLASNTQEP